MIEIKRAMLQNETVFAMFQRLMREPLPVKAAYKMKRYADKMDQEQKNMERFFHECRKKHLVIGEDGKVKTLTDENGQLQPVITDREELDQNLREYMTASFTIDGVNKLASFELEGVKLTAEELSVLEPFIDDLDSLVN